MPVKKTRVLVLILAVIPALFSCAGGDPAGRQVFHYNEATGIASLDPAFAKNQSVMWAAHQLFNTLVEVNDSLQIVPSLAGSWEISDDRTVYRFHLRRDVFFHDDEAFPGGQGRLMRADDLVFSLSRLMDPVLASPGAWIFNNKLIPDQPFRALDDSTLEIRLIRPYTPILGILSMQYCSVLAPEAVRKYGPELRRHPVGTGPFRLVTWEEGQALVLGRHPRYFERDSTGAALPYLRGISISFYDSKATEFLLFRQGQLHFINEIESSFKDEVLDKRGRLRQEWTDKIRLNLHPYLNTEYFGILVDTNNALVRNSPLKWKKVRQAINYGFDKRKMMVYLRNSLGTAAESGFVPAGLPSFDTARVKGYHFDPARSRRLLGEAGFPEGRGLPLIKLTTIPAYADMGDFVAKQLGEIGIPVQVEVVQKALLLQMTANSSASFFRGSWIADYPDAENYLAVFYSKNPAPPNYTRYKNPVFDDLFERALRETNDSLRYRLYQEADRVMIEDAPVVPLWYDQVIHLVQPAVTGFKPNPLNLLELRRTRIGPD